MAKAVKKKNPPSVFAKIYYTAGNPNSYTGSVRKLAKAAKSTHREAKLWLSGQHAYTRYKPARKRFSHDGIFVQGFNEQWSIDLISIIPLHEHNDGYKYLLTVVDSLSKYAFVEPLKSKSGPDVARALEKIFRERTPRKIRSDLGKEFYNTHVQNLFQRKKILHIGALNATKASIVERFNRTLRGKLWRFFDASNTWRYVEILPKMVSSYNDSKHGATKIPPSDVTDKNQTAAWKNLYGPMLKERRTWRRKRKPGERAMSTDMRVGTLVRLSKAKHVFETGYSYAWTKELFQIYQVLPPLRGVTRSKHRYRVKDMRGEKIRGSFQREEIQRVRDVEREVKKVVRRTKLGKYVTWRGYPETLRTFIPKAAEN